MGEVAAASHATIQNMFSHLLVNLFTGSLTSGNSQIDMLMMFGLMWLVKQLIDKLKWEYFENMMCTRAIINLSYIFGCTKRLRYKHSLYLELQCSIYQGRTTAIKGSFNDTVFNGIFKDISSRPELRAQFSKVDYEFSTSWSAIENATEEELDHQHGISQQLLDKWSKQFPDITLPSNKPKTNKDGTRPIHSVGEWKYVPQGIFHLSDWGVQLEISKSFKDVSNSTIGSLSEPTSIVTTRVTVSSNNLEKCEGYLKYCKNLRMDYLYPLKDEKSGSKKDDDDDAAAKKSKPRRYIYLMTGSVDDNGLIIFQRYPFKNQRTFDSIFMDEKDELIKLLDFFNEKVVADNHNLNFNKSKVFDVKVNDGVVSGERKMTVDDLPTDIKVPLRTEATNKFIGLFEGPPGTGKTVSAVAAAQHLDRNMILCSFQLIRTNNQFQQLLSSNTIAYRTPGSNEIEYASIDPANCTLYFDEIDVTHGQKRNVLTNRAIPPPSNAADSKQAVIVVTNSMDEEVKTCKNSKNNEVEPMSDELSLGGILSGLDGAISVPGLMVLMSCNTIDNFDPAFLREGRISKMIKFTYMKPNNVVDMLNWSNRCDFKDNPLVTVDMINNGTPEKLVPNFSPAKLEYIMKVHYPNLKAMVKAINSLQPDKEATESIFTNKFPSRMVATNTNIGGGSGSGVGKRSKKGLTPSKRNPIITPHGLSKLPGIGDVYT